MNNLAAYTRSQTEGRSWASRKVSCLPCKCRLKANTQPRYIMRVFSIRQWNLIKEWMKFLRSKPMFIQYLECRKCIFRATLDSIFQSQTVYPNLFNYVMSFGTLTCVMKRGRAIYSATCPCCSKCTEIQVKRNMNIISSDRQFHCIGLNLLIWAPARNSAMFDVERNQDWELRVWK
jgi:hypothetical protein